MPRLPRLNLNRNLWASSSDDDDDSDHNNIRNAPKSNRLRPMELLQPIRFSWNDDNHGCLSWSLSAAYPSFDQVPGTSQHNHLLLPNIPRKLLTNEQRHCYENRHSFLPSFEFMDEYMNNNFPSFFVLLYRKLFTDLSQRLHVNDAVIDYNYRRLRKCVDLMIQQRIDYGLQKHALSDGDMSLHEYSIALEFYLQMDKNIFFMKTCSFRGAVAHTSSNFQGIFCLTEPYASYGMSPCKTSNCRFCYPPGNISKRTPQHQAVVKFSSAQNHRFVNGYRSILNCPATCQTRNILYVLTCPCGQYDYIGYTTLTLGQRLAYHRQHGNRIMHEFILGQKNIQRVQTNPKTFETLVKDDMLLYRHSARCPVAMQLFLQCNPQYWPLIPMLAPDAQYDNRSYKLPVSIPSDPTSPIVTNTHTRSDQEAGCCMTDLPPFPSKTYTFSTRQCAHQFEYFKNKQDYILPDFNLDLYQAAIVAVLPDDCSQTFYRLLEALFVTHAETKLNTMGHLEQNGAQRTRPKLDIVADRGDWCRNLYRHRSLSLPPMS
ncbi:unnamed protein product [Adineta ricciae]|uniref:GIY-YIG domain-containing protein n=1 Tax=Adineta ricciae TaxID=249248 RepID=A0A815TLD4_ADIRI|nr:unnamed protein product [Adineta ricciae]CAF1506736.1 unnamed protein product [Adineta ricciae]